MDEPTQQICQLPVNLSNNVEPPTTIHSIYNPIPIWKALRLKNIILKPQLLSELILRLILNCHY